VDEIEPSLPMRRSWSRLALTVGAVALVIVAAVWALGGGRSSNDGACDATVYEGCPERWDDLLTDGN